MNLKVNQDKCIGCGQCVSICEDVFNFNDDGLAEVIETPVKEEHIEDFEYLKEVIVDELFMIYVGDDILSYKLNLTSRYNIIPNNEIIASITEACPFRVQ